MRSSPAFPVVMASNTRLQTFVHQTPNVHFLSYVAQQASVVIACHPSPSKQSIQIPPLSLFVSLLASRSQATSGTLLTALVLMDRLQSRLTPVARGISCTCQRIFLATLIITFKILHDSTLRNSHWAQFAHYFTVTEINLMEKQLLALLDYNLSITMDDLSRALQRYDGTLHQTSVPSVIYKGGNDASRRSSVSSSSSSSSINSLSSMTSLTFSTRGSMVSASSNESPPKQKPHISYNLHSIHQKAMWHDPTAAAVQPHPVLVPSLASRQRRHFCAP